MAEPDHSSSSGPGRGRGLRGLFNRLMGHAPEPEDVASGAEEDGDLVEHARAFEDLSVEDVMRPRADILALELSATFDEVVARFAEAEHSRMPVYRETLDDPVGVVHIKDLIGMVAPADPDIPPSPPWKECVLHRVKRELLYVPASMLAADLLLKMRVARIHMAMVIDEFGGTDGLVTMEDLVEAVVGDIADEYDEAAPAHIVARPAGVFEADARASLEELEQALGESVASEELEEEIDTVGGLVAALAGRVPQRGEVISRPGFEFEVTDADPRRIKHVRIRKLERPAMDAASPKPVDEV